MCERIHKLVCDDLPHMSVITKKRTEGDKATRESEELLTKKEYKKKWSTNSTILDFLFRESTNILNKKKIYKSGRRLRWDVYRKV